MDQFVESKNSNTEKFTHRNTANQVGGNFHYFTTLIPHALENSRSLLSSWQLGLNTTFTWYNTQLPRIKKEYHLNKWFYPFLALLLVLVSCELMLRINNDFGLVYPYQDYFFNKRMKEYSFKGMPWVPLEYTNYVKKDDRMRYVRPLPDLSKEKNIIFLLGDSITESASMKKDLSYFALFDDKSDDFSVVSHYFPGCSLKSLAIMLNNYYAFFKQGSKIHKPNYAVIQLRIMSYKGGNTNFFDQELKKMVDYQDKLPINNELADVVKMKRDFLGNFKLNPKFSNDFKDQIFRKVVLGEIHILSLLSWKLYHWLNQAATSYPNNEKLISDQSIEDLYWARFEKSLQLLIKIANKNKIKIGVLLVPGRDFVDRYMYTRSYDELEVRYKNIFAKYNVPFEYAIEEFYEKSREVDEPLFWKDGHPSILGSQALSKSMEKLVRVISE